jgi:hypothetical protein
MITAAHCVLRDLKNPDLEDPLVHWQAWDEQTLPFVGQIKYLGQVEQISPFPTHDWVKIDVTGTEWDTWNTPQGWRSMVAYWQNEKVKPAIDEEYEINGEAPTIVGQSICHSGATTGSSCGQVLETDLSLEREGGMGYDLVEVGGTCQWGGDSGGPWFFANIAYGIHNAGDGPAPCEGHAFYQEITQATKALDVKLAPKEGEYSTCATKYGVDDHTGPGPRAVSRCNTDLNVFYRDVNGNLGNQWWSSANGWINDTRSASMASDPHPIVRPNSDINVFYRDTNGDLGNYWWNPSNGWLDNTIDTSMASEPHPLVRENDNINVFYRDTNGNLGNYWWSSTNGWVNDTRSASIAARPPKATTGSASGMGEEGATVKGTVNPEASATSYYFEYGETTSYGSKKPASPSGIGSGVGDVAVSQTLSDLESATTHHYRLVATSSEGTVYGGDQTFATTSDQTAGRLAAMPVSEAFNGNSASLARFNSNWGALGWASGSPAKGTDTATGWGPASAYSTLNGAYYNASFPDSDSGAAAVATLAASPESGERHFSLWLDMATPSGAKKGYELRFTNASANTYNVKISKWQSGSETVLASKSNQSLVVGNSVAIVDRAGTVSAWVNSGAGYVRQLKGLDSAFSSGNAGLQGAGASTRLSNFRAGRLTPSTATEPVAKAWRLRNSNSFGSPAVSFDYGNTALTSRVGDWDGDGIPTVATFDTGSGIWNLRNSNGPGPAEITIQYGGGPWNTPVVGDWNGDGIDTIGVVDPSTHNWNLRNSNLPGNPDISFQYGGANSTPVVGNWDGAGADGIGVYYNANGNWDLRQGVSGGNPDISFQYGGSTAEPVVGNWDGVGAAGIGVYYNANGNWDLRQGVSGGNPDISFQYGGSAWAPIVGDWDGNGSDTAGARSNDPPTYMIGTSNGTAISSWSATLSELSLPAETSAGDFTGDGKADVVVTEPDTGGKYRYVLGTSSGSGISSWNLLKSGMSQPVPFALADFTGDGKADIVAAESEGNGKYRFMLGTSNGSAVSSWNQLMSGMSQPVGFSVSDFTGDGKADVVAAEQ